MRVRVICELMAKFMKSNKFYSLAFNAPYVWKKEDNVIQKISTKRHQWVVHFVTLPSQWWWFGLYKECSESGLPLFQPFAPLDMLEFCVQRNNGSGTGKAGWRNCKPNLKHISRAYFDKQHTWNNKQCEKAAMVTTRYTVENTAVRYIF